MGSLIVRDQVVANMACVVGGETDFTKICPEKAKGFARPMLAGRINKIEFQVRKPIQQ